jgi:D-alanyl-D-alanine carboxypeptidase
MIRVFWSTLTAAFVLFVSTGSGSASPIELLRGPPAVDPPNLSRQSDSSDQTFEGRAIDALFRSAYPKDEPGASVIVTRVDEILLSRGYGLADAEHSVPNRSNTIFKIGSITKQFTATAILILENEGRLSLSDDIRAYLPDYPTHGKEITLEQLLSHTSGIPDYVSLPGFFQNYVRKTMSVEAMTDQFKDEDLQFDPGTAWSYSGSGYHLLGAVIEKVSGMGYAEFVDVQIFQPLGMTSSYYDNHEMVIPNRAHGYVGGVGAYKNSPFLDMSIPFAGGALISSVEDLHRWNDAMLNGDLLGPEQTERAWTSGHLSNGEETEYGLGWGLAELKGRRFIYHPGTMLGFEGLTATIPEERIFIAILSNNPSKAGPEDFTKKIASYLLGDPLNVAENAIKLPVETLANYEGSYRISDEESFVVTLESEVLYATTGDGAKTRMFFSSPSSFFYEWSPDTGTFDSDGGDIAAATLISWPDTEVRAQKQ